MHHAMPQDATSQAVLPTPALRSRLPDVGTTIFTVMSALATEHKAVNLGQGFPDFACDPVLLDAVSQAMHQGHNQYPPMAGVLTLRKRSPKNLHTCTVTATAPQTRSPSRRGRRRQLFRSC